jgi:signal transduction histidine kinase
MDVHDISGPGEPQGLKAPEPAGGAEAALEAWRAAMASDAKVQQMVKTLEDTLAQVDRRRRHVQRVNQVAGVLAATTRVESLGALAMEVLGIELNSRRGGFFALEGANYVPVAALGIPLGSLVGYSFPAPNPFPDHPLVLFQSQWLEDEVQHRALGGFRLMPQDGLLFVPFEHQLFLMGFAVLSLPKEPALDEASQELLEVLQHLFAIALNNAWLFRDLQQQRSELALQAEALRQQAETLVQLQAASHMGQAVKGEFVAFASQEMTRQLSELLGLLRLGHGGAYSPAEAGHAFEDAFYLGQHMQALLADLSALAQAEERELTICPIPSQAFFGHLAQRLVALPRKLGAEVVWPALEEGLPELVADPDLLSLVLLHLIHGALYRSGSTIQISFERTPVTFILRIPIPGADLRSAARVLREAGRGPIRDVPEGPAGTGLSLVVCRALLMRMGGKLDIEATVGQSDLLAEIPVVP